MSLLDKQYSYMFVQRYINYCLQYLLKKIIIVILKLVRIKLVRIKLIFENSGQEYIVSIIREVWLVYFRKSSD